MDQQEKWPIQLSGCGPYWEPTPFHSSKECKYSAHVVICFLALGLSAFHGKHLLIYEKFVLEKPYIFHM